MEVKTKNCSNKLHENVEAIIYCQKCDIYMCNKCKQMHSDLFQSHQLYPLDKDKNAIFTEFFTVFCKDSNHNVELEYYCKTHNLLCCAKCISKIKTKNNGKHGNCEVCEIDDIKKEKKEKLNENIKILEELSVNLKKSVEEMKNMFENMNKDKENAIINIQKIFTQLRNKINKKEDEIIAQIKNKFDKLYFKEDFLKTSTKLPNKVNKLLEQGKLVNKEWKEEKIISSINNCIQIEQSIKKINTIKEKIKKINNKKIFVKFCKNEDKEEIENNIEDFGNIIYKKYKYKYSFRECPLNLEKNKKYEILGKNQNIASKTGKNSWTQILCENKLSKRRLNCWKIKINSTLQSNILVGISTNDFNANELPYYNNGWYICLCCGELFSGFNQNNMKVKTIYDVISADEIIFIMNMKKKSLKILLNSEEEEIYSEININKPLFPAVILRNQFDNVEITDYYKEYKELLKEKKNKEKKEELKEEPKEETK